MKAITRLYVSVVAGLILSPSGLAQDRCGNAPDYFEPLTGGDGQRYPLTIGPLVWHLVGSGVYAVKGSDGLIHLAFAMQFTNAWNQPAIIQSVEVVDPAKSYKPTGKDRVLSIKDEDVTGMMKLSSLPPTLDQASYSSKNRRRRVRSNVFRCDLCPQQRGTVHDCATGSRASAGEQTLASIRGSESPAEGQHAGRDRSQSTVHGRWMG